MQKESTLSIKHPIMFSIVSLGPVGWFFVDYYSQRHERLAFLFVTALLLSILSTVFWGVYINRKPMK